MFKWVLNIVSKKIISYDILIFVNTYLCNTYITRDIDYQEIKSYLTLNTRLINGEQYF